MQRILVTGGAGFIGSNFVRELLAVDQRTEITVLDKLTYAANPMSLADLPCKVVKADIADRETVQALLRDRRPEAIVHLAAETHVDRSIDAPEAFVQTNLVGTYRLLEETRRYLLDAPAGFRLINVSTDEVFGALAETGSFSERSRYAPSSPYSASKAGADHLVDAYARTYDLPTITTHCTNNYGPYQHPEKLIPRMITCALEGARLPVYGAGRNVRDWIAVADHCAALRAVLAHGQLGAHYVIGARCERSNLEVVRAICDLLDELVPRQMGSYREQIDFVADRPGHDFRYAVDPSQIERQLGWSPHVSFADGLRRTVAWYIANRAWVAASRELG